MISECLKYFYSWVLVGFCPRFSFNNEHKCMTPLQFISAPVWNSCSHWEASSYLGKALAHRQGSWLCPLVPAESKQRNLCAKLRLILMDWVEMLAEGSCSKSHQKWLIGCELWSQNINWETQYLFPQSYNPYFQGKQKDVCLCGWEEWQGKGTGTVALEHWCLCHKG